MKNTEFVEDDDTPDGAIRTTVHDALTRAGWLDSSVMPKAVADALAPFLIALLAEWAAKNPSTAVAWDAIAEGLAGRPGANRYERRMLVDDARHEVCALFCRIAGIGDVGHAFDFAAAQAGLHPAHRDEGALKDLAKAIRRLEVAANDPSMLHPVGLLFERVRQWPFLTDADPKAWTTSSFRDDVRRYVELTDLDLSSLDEYGLRTPDPKDLGQPTQLCTWIELFGVRTAWSWFEKRLGRPLSQREPTVREQVLTEAACMRPHLVQWLERSGHGASGFMAAGPEFQDGAEQVFLTLMKHAADIRIEGDPKIATFRFGSGFWAATRMWYARAAYDGRPSRMPKDAKALWLRAVKQEMAAFRPVLSRDENPKDGWQEKVLQVDDLLHPSQLEPISPVLRALRERDRVADLTQDDSLRLASTLFEKDREHFLACADQVFQFEGLWEGMRQLLLAIRALRSPCVASDLRYWEEKGLDALHYPRQPDEVWRCIPAKLVTSFHALVGQEEANDSKLEALRSKFASYCLQGLCDRWREKEREEAATAGRQRADKDMVEESWHWRYCRVRAAKTLAINPDARGHRLLLLASKNDPHPDVREAANDAYQSLRRGVGLPEGISPRRAVLGAFWWLRQAHLRALDIPIDADGARRTRRKELDRTKEPEPK